MSLASVFAGQGSADCGPSSALQQFSKQVDRDRGAQQDRFVPQAGPSQWSFRTTTPAGPSTPDPTAQHFFSPSLPHPHALHHHPHPHHPPQPFDLSSLSQSLSPSPAPDLAAAAAPPAAAWASDFLSSQKQHAEGPISRDEAAQLGRIFESAQASGFRQDAAWAHDFAHFASEHPAAVRAAPPNQLAALGRPAFASQLAPAGPLAFDRAFQSAAEAEKWETQFASHAAATATASTTSQQTTTSSDPLSRPTDPLAQTAASLLSSLEHEQSTNTKFANSAFLGLMRRLVDGQARVEGETMVDPGADAPSSAWLGEFASVSGGRGKGKGNERAVDHGWAADFAAQMDDTQSVGPASASLQPGADWAAPPPGATQLAARAELTHAFSEFQQFVPSVDQLHKSVHFPSGAETATAVPGASTLWEQDDEAETVYDGNTRGVPGAQEAEWDRLQEEWDRFEATAVGVRPVPGEYVFAENNPFVTTRNHRVHSAWDMSPSQTTLEAEAQVLDNPSSPQAWFQLGVTQQENERESQAIAALSRAVALDESYADAWLALAISYTNEMDRTSAQSAVASWVRTRGRGRDADAGRTLSAAELVDVLVDMAREGVQGDVVDADVQVALGVMFSLSEEYGKGVDCFRSALSVRPEDWLLFNRLGATLANSGDSRGALDYYYRALELHPTYIRAKFNLGISLIHLDMFQEAAQQILSAISLQQADTTPDDAVAAPIARAGTPDHARKGITSASLWDTLRSCLIQMQRSDLTWLCDAKDVDAFREHFDF